MMSSLSQNEIIIYGLLAAFLCGGIIFFLSGLIRVKDNNAVVVERVGLYYKTLYKGIHYFMPLGYRRVATYPICVEKTSEICGKIIEINVKINDIKNYHYSVRKIDNILEELGNLKYNSINEYIIDLSQKLTEISCSIQKKGD